MGFGVRGGVASVLEPYPLDRMRDGAHGAPLVPWPNRLAGGRYSFDGEDHQLAITEPERQNAIHGLLLWRPWRAVERAGERIVMGTRLHPLPGYPFTLDLEIAYELSDHGLSVATTARNAGDRACPYGHGQHPYLSPAQGLIDDCSVQLEAGTRILTDPERQLPAGSEPVRGTPFDFGELRTLGDTPIDHPVHRSRPPLRSALHRRQPPARQGAPRARRGADDLPAQRVRDRGEPCPPRARRVGGEHVGSASLLNGVTPARRTGATVKRTLKAFYDDQMTHHAAALTYYSLMSLFPAVLLGCPCSACSASIPRPTTRSSATCARWRPPRWSNRSTARCAGAPEQGHGGHRPGHQRRGRAVRHDRRSLGRAAGAQRRVSGGLRAELSARKAVDIASTFVLMTLVLVTLVLAFVGGHFAEDLLGFVGLGPTAARIWNLARWPAAVAMAMLVFAYIYYVTPDVKHRSFRWVTPGAVVGVLLWLAASFALSTYVSRVADVGAIYGTFAGAIVLVAWLWLTNAACCGCRAERGDRARAGYGPGKFRGP